MSKGILMVMRYIYLSPSILILLIAGCSRPNTLDTLSTAEDIINLDPDSASVLLANIKYPEDLPESQRAEYYFLSAKAHQMLSKAMIEDSTILFALEYYKKHQDENKTLTCYNLAISYYQWKNDLDNYYATIQEGIRYAGQHNDSIALARFYERMGYYSYGIRDYQESNRNFQQELNYAENYCSGYMLALNYSLLGKTDSVGLYMESAIQQALQAKDTTWACHYIRNYASILLYTHNYPKAIEQLQRAAGLSGEYKDFLSSHLIMTEIYLNLNNLDSALYYLDKAKTANEREYKELTMNADYAFSKNTIALLENVISYKRDNKLDIVPIGRYNDSIIVEIYKHNKKLEEQITTKEQLKQQNLQLTIDKQRAQLYIMYCILFLVIIVTFLYWYTMNRKAKLQETQERMEALQQLLKDATSNRAQDQGDSFFFRRILLQQLGVIRLAANSPSAQNQEFLRQMANLNNDEELADGLLVWEDLYLLIDSIYDGFYSGLKQKYGEVLLEKEIQLCCLLCAGFSTKEISVVTQQSVRTIYQRKTTIRQKLQMEEKEDITDFISSRIKA